jgi:hypothetical protein
MQDAPQNSTSDPRFKIFHDLMPHKIRHILLVSRQYDAWVMEEDCRLSERIVKEYRGLNLSHPPRLRWVSDAQDALRILSQQQFDLIIIMARGLGTYSQEIAATITSKCHGIPVILMVHQGAAAPDTVYLQDPAIDRTFLWAGNTDVLFALIKSTEDWINAEADTSLAGIRVILFVEDSPEYMSAILPILFRELVRQAQAVMEESLNEEHRLLAMRARPKILLAESYEKALQIYEGFKDNILGVVSDMRFPRKGKLDGEAGLRLLEKIKAERFDIPLLLVSTESENRSAAARIPARFVDKNSQTLPSDIRKFFKEDLGFGDFVFRSPDGREIGRATHLREFEKGMLKLPPEAFQHHCSRNDFSRWLFARSEIELAAKVRPIRDEDFSDARSHCNYLVSVIHQRRMQRQRGIVVDFDSKYLDRDFEFCKIGGGSLGGKARGLAFMNTLLHQQSELHDKYPGVTIHVPQTLVITTEGFEDFIEFNGLQDLAEMELADVEVAERFMAAPLPIRLIEKLGAYLTNMHYPLAVRSSSLLEDAQYRAYAGLYNTYMLANDHDDVDCRLDQLVTAVKLVYASTYFSGPKAFSKRVGHRTEEEAMAVIIQQLMGGRHGHHFYPAISGVAQSYNYYPFSHMKAEDGVAAIALGLGKAVMGGESSLRFSPRHPKLLPDRSTVEDQLQNSQRFFYSLILNSGVCQLGVDDGLTLKRREIYDALSETPIRNLSSTYYPEEGRIRDLFSDSGIPVVTFHPVLKYEALPLAGLLRDLLKLGEQGMGSPVEMEFCVNLDPASDATGEFVILQLRPMGAREEFMRVVIGSAEIGNAIVYARQALGNTIDRTIEDIVYVKPADFDPARTRAIAEEIGRINGRLRKEGRKYLLIGPGRWGSADRWLGIPVRWEDISGVGVIVEADHPKLRAEPSQGSHFFHNITTMGINYLTISKPVGGHIDWEWLMAQPRTSEGEHVVVIHLEQPFVLKVDGRHSCAVFRPATPKRAAGYHIG